MNEMLKIGRRGAVNRHGLARTRMDKLKARCMQRHASDQPLPRFLRVIFSIPYHRVTDGGKLHPDLILQSGYQLNPNE